MTGSSAEWESIFFDKHGPGYGKKAVTQEVASHLDPGGLGIRKAHDPFKGGQHGVRKVVRHRPGEE